MSRRTSVRLALSATVAVCQFGIAAAAYAQASSGHRVISDYRGSDGDHRRWKGGLVA
jgi:hypothetical protein